MGTGDKEPAKTIMLPYLQRADELQKHDPLVAYYCRLYAMERGLKVPSKERSKTMNALLISLMNQLEKDKRTVKLSPDDNLHVEGFALNVFSKADKQDRAGRADLNTAKTFYAASIFFEILNQFGELQPEIEQKQKYAVWKAADIRKALSEGRRPEPGPPGGDAGFSIEVSTTEEVAPPSETLIRSGSTSPTFQDQHVVHNSTTSFYSPPSPPPVDHHPPESMSFQNSFEPSHHPQNINENEQWRSSEFPKESNENEQGRSSEFPKESNENEPWRSSEYPKESNEFPSIPFAPNYQQHQASSAFYPSSSFPTARAPGDYHSPPAYPSFHQAPAPASAQQYPSAPPAYESPQKLEVDYKPTPEKVSEAHKASRFAVSALAFDDVPTAISYLKRSLELLTSPSAT